MLLLSVGLAQEKATSPDTRVWSISYWMKMAEKGIVPYNPTIEVPPAEYTGSEIRIPGMAVQNSPDVPIINSSTTTQSENSVFVNPNNPNKVLNSNNSTDFPVTGVFGADYWMTTDGGNTWNGSIQGAGGPNSGDPAAAISLNNRYYIGYIAANGGQGVAYSTNEGSSWTHVQVANPPFGGLLDKNHLWVDNSGSSPYTNYLYDAWTNFGGTNDGDIEFSRSTNGGLTWSSPVNISSAVGAGSHNQGVNIQTGPNGEVYAVWAIYDSWPSDETALGFAKSTNGGATWLPASRIITNIRGIRNTGTSKNMRVNSFPVMAVDISGGPRNGWIYVVWANYGTPGINTGPDIDVYMIRSNDGGATWSSPIRVNQDTPGLGNEHYFPWITCDPVTGNLSVIFYDDRNVASNQCEVFVATSSDGGTTWNDFKVSDVAFTPAPIPGLANGYFGDYLGISAYNDQVYPVWTDNRAGNALA
ncbi:MAG: exo-alpha-sialidase, partial [Methanobacteriota archaeon]